MADTALRRFAGRLRRLDVATRRGLAVGIAALAAPLAGASPTGTRLADIAWAAAIVAGLTFLASHAKRGPLLVAAGVAAVTAIAVSAAVAAVLAAVCGAISTRRLHRRAPFTRGLAGGACAISLLASTGGTAWWVGVAAWSTVAVLITASAWRHVPEHQQRRVVVWGSVALVLAVVALGAALAGILSARRAVDDGTVALSAGLSAARRGDVSGAAAALDVARADLRQAADRVGTLGSAGRLLPIAAQNIDALDSVLSHVADATGRAALAAAGTDEHALTVTGGKIDVDAIAALAKPLGELAAAMDQVVVDLDGRRSDPLLPPLRDRMDRLRAQSVRARDDAHLGAVAATQAPLLLGRDRPRRYLVLFTSPSEARGRFGFPGSYAEVVLDHGDLQLGAHGAVSEDLFAFSTDQSAFAVDDSLEPYLQLGATREFRSVTIPPDFTVVARDAAKLWAQSGRAPVDGVVRLDPTALAALTYFTGPVAVAGVPTPLTYQNLEQFLVLGQYVQFPDEQAPRREVLSSVSDVTFERLDQGSLPAPRVLADVFGSLVRDEHLQVDDLTGGSTPLLDLLGLSGRFAAPNSDAVAVTAVNSAANKIDAFARREVAYRATVGASGQASGTVAVTMHNDAPSHDLPFYVIGSLTTPRLPPGTNRTTLLVYTALEPSAVRVGGADVAHQRYRTQGRWLTVVTVDLAPGASSVVEVDVGGTLAAGAPYSLTLTPGGGATPDSYAVDVALPHDRSVSYGAALPTPTTLIPR